MKLRLSLGFTLVELLVTLSVAGILLAIGVPNFTTMIQNNRMSAKINEVVAEVNFARSEAVKRGFPVTICKRNAAGTGCDNAASWISGWIVFTDVNVPNGDGIVDAGTDTILRVHGALAGLTSINYTRSRITFNGSGAGVGGVNNDTITFCDSRGISKAKGLVMSNTGRLRKAIATDNLACP